MSVSPYCDLIRDVNQIALDAGDIIMEIYATDFDVEHKNDRSPVTAADMAAHDYIYTELKNLTPEIPIISEEDELVDFSERRDWQYYWLVDPLDGTREFVKRNGEFTVNIALIEKQQPILGVIYAPVQQTLYFACRDKGAWRSIKDSEREQIRVRSRPGDRLIVAGSRSHRGTSLEKFLANVGGEYEVIGVGSSLKSCMVAEGSADIYARLGPTSEWDTAAAQCIVEQAGGGLTDTHMQPLRYNTRASILNPYFLVFGDTSRDWSKYL
ncbi:MAG: 3'(2'),5'-bisphosphate nucleotidase CysQ [Gammaproteobacteria bacterium]|nr:MAG: 3'(2'),5'-bisphosphate nucleotidase CysQ [Gammaproteobacteria bacterium]